MASAHELKAKQKSVKAIHKITNAMELVSTAKSRKAVKELNDYRNYYEKVDKVVKALAISPDYKVREEYNNTLWVVFTSDLGLAGAYNNNVIKIMLDEFKTGDEVIAIGNKAVSAMRSRGVDHKGYPVVALKEEATLDEIVAEIQTSHFERDKRVNVIYTEYLSQITFEAKKKQLLPIEKPEDEVETQMIEFEPSAEVVMKEMLDTYIPSVLIGFYKEANASEQSSRRVAMENATSNGEELLEKLDIEFNKQRQAKITQELSEISAGAESLKED